VALVLFWAAAAVLFVGMRYAAPALVGSDLPDWTDQRWVLLGWMMWVPMTYLAVGMARLFPLDSPRWPVYVPVHVIGAVACSAVGGVLWVSLIWVLTGGEVDVVDRLRRTFVGSVPIDSIIYFAVLVGVYGFDYYRLHKEDQRRTERLRAELAEAELTTLRTQLNPHFLFNALNAVASHIRVDAGEAVQMVAELGDFLRAVLELGGRHVLPVHREIEMLQRYLAVQQIRFGGELEVTVEVDPEARGARVPSLVLQPLVENAIHHGIRRRRGGGRIWVIVERHGDRVSLRVLDDGDGPPAPNGFPLAGDPSSAGDASRHGVGIENVERRLHHLFGTDYLMAFGRTVHDGTRVTTVAVEVPYRDTAPANLTASDGRTVPDASTVEVAPSSSDPSPPLDPGPSAGRV
jgi:GNAT superfamily N-acetyltransferase